jgi:hypothetical protein
MFIFFIFKATSIMRHFRSFCHIINYVTLWLYNNFPLFQARYIKEVKHYVYLSCNFAKYTLKLRSLYVTLRLFFI